MKKLLAVLLTACLAFPVMGCGGKETIVDFSVKDGANPAFIKKFDNFTSTWPWVGDSQGTVDDRSLNTVPALKEILAESLRVDLFMGYDGLGYNIGRNGDGTTDAEFASTMQLVNKLRESEVNPYLVYFANPKYSQRPEAHNWKNVPDLDKWETLCGHIAAYLKNKGVRLGGHEIWNEPDFGTDFFTGSWSDYIDMYIAGAAGIRAADPDALVGGMSAAHIVQRANAVTTVGGERGTDFARFITRSAAAGQTPDFVSWHYYGRGASLDSANMGENEKFDTYVNAIRTAINTFQDGTHNEAGRAYTELETLQQHVNEFNIFQPSVDGVYMTEKMLPGMFNAMERLLDATDLTRIMWASLLGEKKDGLGYDLIDALSLQRYPAYHALWMYAHLPVDRVKADLKNENIGVMAGADAHRAGMIAYNLSDTAQTASVRLKGIPFDSGTLEVYLVDADHFTYTTANAPVCVRRERNVNPNGVTVDLNLKPNAAYYIQATDETGKSEMEDYAKIGAIARKDYWYPSRGDGKPYAEFNENSLTAHLGMLENATGATAVCSTIDVDGTVEKLKIDYTTMNAAKATADAAVGVKIDYATAGGSKSVYLPVKDFADVMLPFGAKTAADETLTMGGAESGTFIFELKKNAPNGWNGRISVSFVMKDAGSGATAKFILRKA